MRSTIKYSSMNCIEMTMLAGWLASTHTRILTRQANAAHYHECENGVKKTRHVPEIDRENILYLGHGYNKLSKRFSSLRTVVLYLRFKFHFVSFVSSLWQNKIKLRIFLLLLLLRFVFVIQAQRTDTMAHSSHSQWMNISFHDIFLRQPKHERVSMSELNIFKVNLNELIQEFFNT